MTNKKLEQRIRTAVEHAAPNRLDSILSSCDQSDQTIGASAAQAAGQKKGVIHMSNTRRKTGFAAIAAVAAVLLLCFGGFGLLQQGAAPQADSIIMLDVNPSLSLSVDADERVLAAQALNDDAEEVLGTMELEGTTLEVAVNAIIGSMLQKGYLGSAQNSILVSVENADADRGEALQQKVSQLITVAMQSDELDAAVLTQNVSSDNAALVELARTYQISVGKAALIQELVSQDATLSFEALSKMTINEIALIAASRNWSSESVSQTGTASDAAYIGRDAALNTACTHAGISKADLTKFEVEFDSDDGIMIYEVEMETASAKYEYDIDARTGTVLKFEKKDKSSASKPETGSTDTTGASAYIGEAAAKAAALSHAGVSESDTYYIKCYVEYEDGKAAYYTVEFETAQAEYEYEIDLYSGAVLDADAERHSGSSASASTGSGSYIGETAAKAAALSHAGVSESDTYYIKCYVEYEDGNPACYTVEFKTAQAEYEYEIDLYSGAVLDAERETRNSGSTSSSSGSASTSGSYIGESAALSKALAHAGVAETDLTEKRVELDEHSNIMVYEIEFKAGQTEYEYEINAVTGEIVQYKSENHR